MPLNSQQKINHILTVTQKTYAGRQKTVIFVYLSGTTYSYVTQKVIFRFEQIIDPQIQDPSGNAPSTQFDVQIIAPLGTNFVGVVYVADTATATAAAVAAAEKYEVIEAMPIGIVPGGSHIRCLARRLR